MAKILIMTIQVAFSTLLLKFCRHSHFLGATLDFTFFTMASWELHTFIKAWLYWNKFYLFSNNLLHAVKQPTVNFGDSLFIFPLLQVAVWRWIKDDYSLAKLTTG